MGRVRAFIKIFLGTVELTITGQIRKECWKRGEEKVGKGGFSKRNIINHFAPSGLEHHVNSFCMHTCSTLLKT